MSNTEPAPAQVDPVAVALSGPWTLEKASEDWGTRAHVYCPAPGGKNNRKLVTGSLPLPIAELIVNAVNDYLGLSQIRGGAAT